VARILTAAEAAAIEGAVDPTVAAQTDADLAAISAFHVSKAASVWCELVKKHVFPKEDSAAELAVRLKISQMARSQDPSLVPAYYREVTKKTEDQVLRAYLDGDTALRRRLERAAKRKKPGLDSLAVALLAYRELYLEHGKCPKFEQVQESVERRKGKLDPVTWVRVLAVMAPLFD
jgi:hypothetical protein